MQDPFSLLNPTAQFVIMAASMALLSVGLMVLQKTISGITLHYAANHAPYDTEMAVFLGELMKIIIAFLVVVYKSGATSHWRRQAWQDDGLEAEVPMLRKENSKFEAFPSIVSRATFSSVATYSARAAGAGFTWTLVFPAAFYVIMNNLYLKASKLLEPPVFQTLWQMRLLTTAAFSACILKKVITARQYGAIILMLIGLAFAQRAASFVFRFADVTGSGHAVISPNTQDLAMGTSYLALAGLLSSLATVLLEKIFTDREKDLWATNVQLGIFSIIPCSLTLLLKANSFSDDFKPFQNLDTFWPWTAIFIHTFAGLLTSFVLRYAGSIARNIAAGLAILLTFVAARLDNQVSTSIYDFIFLLGASLSLVSSYMYYKLAGRNG